MKRTSKSRVSVIAVIAAVLGGCAQDFDEDYGVYYSGDPATPRRTAAKIKPKIPQIPLPDRALLEAPAEPDCGAAQGPRRPGRPESATATAGLATPAAAEEGAANDANADLALRIKLEYERECYRQAEARMRDRLKQLQASTTQTVKAVKGTEQGAR